MRFCSALKLIVKIARNRRQIGLKIASICWTRVDNRTTRSSCFIQEKAQKMLRLVGLIAVFVCATAIERSAAATYALNGLFSNGANLSGSVNVDRGTLFSVNLNGGNVLPGDAVVWSGTPICAQPNCGPDLAAYSYILGLRTITESYDSASQTYDFHFNGGGTSSSLDLIFALEGSAGVILGGRAFDNLCSPFCPFEPFSVELTGGSLVLTPLPGALSLFIAGLGMIGLLSWSRRQGPKVA
jgi:hypothetical protein